MLDFLSQINKAIDMNLYYVGLYASLSVPDICGALESDDGKATKSKYIQWFDTHVAPKYKGNIDGDVCYYYRCSSLHQGSSQHPNSRYSRILFIEPNVKNIIAHNCILNDVLTIDVRIFCNDIVEGAIAWIKQNKDSANCKKNYDKFMKRYPNGIAPYIVGIPVIS